MIGADKQPGFQQAADSLQRRHARTSMALADVLVASVATVAIVAALAVVLT